MSLFPTLFSSHAGILPRSIITPAMVAPHISPSDRLAVVASGFDQWQKYIMDVGRRADMYWFEPFHTQYHAIREKLRHVVNVQCHSGVPSLTDAASYVNFLGGDTPTAPIVKQLNGYTDSLNILVKGIAMCKNDGLVPEPDAIVIDGGFRVESILPAFMRPIPMVIFQMTTLGGEQALAGTQTFLTDHGYHVGPLKHSGSVRPINRPMVSKYPVWKAVLS